MEILELLESAAMRVIKRKDDNGNYLLHIACEYSCDAAITKLLEIFPIAAQHQNNDGCLPLHIACYSINQKSGTWYFYTISENLLMQIIKVYPEAVFIKCNYDVPIFETFHKGCFPLHLASQCIQSERVIQKLIEINPMVLQERRDDGDYPIHCAYRLYCVDGYREL